MHAICTGKEREDMLEAARDAALAERTGPKGTGGSKARGSMVRTVDPTKMKVALYFPSSHLPGSTVANV